MQDDSDNVALNYMAQAYMKYYSDILQKVIVHGIIPVVENALTVNPSNPIEALPPE